MISMLFHAHSGLRFLVLLAAVVALLVTALGTFGRQPYGRPARIAMAVFTGLLDLQVVLGVLMLIMGCFYGALMGHMMMMLLAAVAAHGCSLYARRQSEGRKAHGVALAGVLLALLLVVGGIASIGRGVVSSSGAPTCPAARTE
jgi:hypothetical protein